MFRAVGISHCRRGLSTECVGLYRCVTPPPSGRGLVLEPSPHETQSNHCRFSSRWSRNHMVHSTGHHRPYTTTTTSRSWWRGSGSSRSLSPANMDIESEPMEVPVESPGEAEQLLTRRIHLLGLGSIGTLIAHSLKCLPNPPPITLLMHKDSMYDNFKKSGRIIRLLNPKTQVNDEQMGYDVDVLRPKEEDGLAHWTHIADHPEESNQPRNPIEKEEKMRTRELYIYNLIVSVKAPSTIEALASLKHRINSDTTICLMQNGMGQIDELNKRVFTDPATRPTYMLGIVSHGAYMHRSFNVVHAGFGSTALGIWRDTDKYPLPPRTSAANMESVTDEERKKMYPSDEELYSNLSSRYLLRTLTRSPVLACAAYPYLDLMQLQLEKLAMNAVLNPLTALLDVPNGSMLETAQMSRTHRLLLAEISLVIRSLPELEGIPGVNFRFSAGRLENLLVAISSKTAQNSSSMREDVRNLRSTEIEYINGYIVRRGDELGMKCVLNYLIMQLIEAKTIFTRPQSRLPYGTSMIEGENADPEGVVLEDKGTKVAGQAY